MADEHTPYQAPMSVVSDSGPPERNVMLQVLRVFGRGFAYAIAMCLVFTFVFRPFFVDRSSTDTSDQATKEQQQQRELMRQYEEQSRKSAELLLESERQQKRMGDVITKQEEQTKRLDAVIQAWERQSRVKR